MLDHGKLNRDSETEDWSNVRRHCLIQAAAWEILGPLLGLTERTTLLLANVAACHDWEKRISKPQQANFFTDDERRTAYTALDRLLQIGAVDKTLFDCLTPRFNLRVLRGEATFLELLQWYVDDIARGDELVPFLDRIAEVAARNPDPEPELMPELEKFGFRQYWDSEISIGTRVGAMIIGIIHARRACILPVVPHHPDRAPDSPEWLLILINNGIMAEINAMVPPEPEKVAS